MYSINIAKEQKMLLYLTARSISQHPLAIQPSEADCLDVCWEKVFLESKLHAVTLATFEALEQEKKYVPDDVYLQWMTAATAGMQRNFACIQAQVELVSLLKENHLPYVILKGTSASAYYPKPHIRTLGDVDFLIDPVTQAQIETILMSSGYRKSHGEHRNHIVFRKPGAHLEMHFEVAGVPYGEIGDKIRVFLKETVYNPVQKRQEISSFSAPQDVYHGLILLLHMQHHLLGEGLGLRHLCDWAVYVERTQGQLFWAEMLLPFLKKIGLFEFAAVMTKTCAKFLLTSCPVWAENVEDELCAWMIEDVLASGNFGRKDLQRSKGGAFISENGRDGTRHSRGYHLFRVLHNETYNKAVRHCPLLYPFVFVWRVLFHFGRIITGKSKPFKVLSAAKKRRRIYNKLKVFGMENKEK